MSKTNKIFESIPVKIPDRSGFDLSHEVLTTAMTGTVVPVTHFEVLPGDTISMGSLMKVTLPPMAVPFMGRIDAELTAAFIPNRLLWNGWQSFITHNNGTSTSGDVPPFAHTADGAFTPVQVDGNPWANVPISVPTVNLSEMVNGALVGPGSLANYLGFKSSTGIDPDVPLPVNALPFLAYHKFCDDWIRDENVMKPFFPKMYSEVFTSNSANPDSALPEYWALTGRFLPYSAYGGLSVFSNSYLQLPPVVNEQMSEYGLPFDQSLGLGSLRQRCWAKDYFTTATTRPQAGDPSRVTFTVDTVSGAGGFTVADLRMASSLQKWLERNNLAGTEYGSQILAHWGVTPPDYALNRSVLLGSVRTNVYVSSVENNAGVGNSGASGTKSPYGNVLGAAGGFAGSAGEGSLVNEFTAKEHGYIMVFFSLIPHAYYNTGLDRSLLHRYVGDYAWPEFASIGDQPIRNIELTANLGRNDHPAATWGYQQRYVEYKHKLDSITGLLSDGQNLSPYALQRGFSVLPELSSDFLEIPTNYLDQVSGVSSEISRFGCMVDVYFDCKALRVLPEYSLPAI